MRTKTARETKVGMIQLTAKPVGGSQLCNRLTTLRTYKICCYHPLPGYERQGHVLFVAGTYVCLSV